MSKWQYHKLVTAHWVYMGLCICFDRTFKNPSFLLQVSDFQSRNAWSHCEKKKNWSYSFVILVSSWYLLELKTGTITISSMPWAHLRQAQPISNFQNTIGYSPCICNTPSNTPNLATEMDFFHPGLWNLAVSCILIYGTPEIGFLTYHVYIARKKNTKHITGWWYTYPSEKYELVSWDDDIPNIWKNKHVPKHQSHRNMIDIRENIQLNKLITIW